MPDFNSSDGIWSIPGDFPFFSYWMASSTSSIVDADIGSVFSCSFSFSSISSVSLLMVCLSPASTKTVLIFSHLVSMFSSMLSTLRRLSSSNWYSSDFSSILSRSVFHLLLGEFLLLLKLQDTLFRILILTRWWSESMFAPLQVFMSAPILLLIIWISSPFCFYHQIQHRWTCTCTLIKSQSQASKNAQISFTLCI